MFRHEAAVSGLRHGNLSDSGPWFRSGKGWNSLCQIIIRDWARFGHLRGKNQKTQFPASEVGLPLGREFSNRL